MTTDDLLSKLRALHGVGALADVPTPAPEQVWRASWRDEGRPVASVVIIAGEVDGRYIEVIPATIDAQVGDEQTMEVKTSAGVTLEAWLGLLRRIPIFTLEQRFADLSDPSAAAIFSGRPTGKWTPIVSALDDRRLAWADLFDRINALADAEWVPTEEAGPSLREVASMRGLVASDLAKALHINAGAARRLIDGTAQPTSEQRERLRDVLGEAAAAAARFDSGCVAALDQPKFRAAIRAKAHERFNDDEITTRVTFANKLMGIAARHRGGSSRNWDALLEQILDEG